MNLVGLLVALLIICVILWAAKAILGALNPGEPIRTIIWVVIVVICAIVAINVLSGLAGGLNLGGLSYHH